jgi:phosphoglycolate phosphatase
VNDLTGKYNSIIWDWNGTLLNDMWLCIEVVNGILKKRNGSQLDMDTYKNVFGFPITDYYRRIGIDFEKESFENLAKVFIANYETGVKKCKLHPSALTLLSTFKKLKKKQFMLTASHIDSVMKLLNYHSITHYFDDIEGLDNHHAESKIEIGKRLLDENSIVNNSALLIGDTLHDFEVASEIGIDCVMVSNGHQSKERLIEGTIGQVVVLDSIEELFD